MTTVWLKESKHWHVRSNEWPAPTLILFQQTMVDQQMRLTNFETTNNK